MNILHIDSSILGAVSVSRQLSAGIVARLQAQYPDADLIYRDLVADAALHLSDQHVEFIHGGAVTNPLISADVALGLTYIDELFAADIIVIGAPMYNFSIPSQLKGWIDRVVVAGRSFRYDANGVEGLVKGKKLIVASSRGGFYTGDSPMAALDFHETYLRSMLGFVGLTDVRVIRVEGVNVGAEAKAAAIGLANDEIASLVA